jgi:hypothetical protein
MAWVKTISPNPSVRDGAEAVRLAERASALTDRKVPVCLGTLAAAYAEAGRFPEAVATAKRLILCDGNDKSLEACRADMATVKQSLTVETATAEQCKTALKGGTFWQRLKSDAVKITIAGAIGVVAGYAAHR